MLISRKLIIADNIVCYLSHSKSVTVIVMLMLCICFCSHMFVKTGYQQPFEP